MIAFDFQLQEFQQLFTTPVITPSNNNPAKPNNFSPTNFLNFDVIVTPSIDVDCNFLDETSDFISPQGYKSITENEVNSFMDCSSGMINCFPVIFDSGASLAIAPCKDDFVGEIKVPDKSLRLGGLALGLPINGKRTIEWIFETATENVVIRTQAYYVPNGNVRLLSPQRLFNKDKGIIGEFTCREEHASLQFQGVPNVIIDYDSRSKLPIALGKNKAVSAHRINLCVTDDDNQNLTPSQKTLLQWYYRFEHKNCASLQAMLRSEPFTSHKFLPASRCELPQCEVCHFAKAHRRPTKGKTSSVDITADGSLKDGHLSPGAAVSIDHFESRLKGRTYDSFGKTSSDQYVGGCIFVDHMSGYIHVEPQLGFSTSESIRVSR